MKTADKAATMVAEFLNGNDVAANTIIRRLADAGLLVPDLPEPDVDNGIHHIYKAVDNLDVVSLTDHVQINCLESDGRTAVWDGKPAEARVFAHSLLAAADEAEGEQ